MKILVTGVGGFTGHYLIDEFIRNDGHSHEIFGLHHQRAPQKENIGYQPVHGDLCDYSCMESIISELSPEIIVHLAGLTRGTTSDLLTVNIAGTENLLNAVNHSGINPRILVISSSAEYGYQGDTPITESARVQPVTTYGISKAGLSFLSLMHAQKQKMRICIARPFNLVGPGQNEDFLCGTLISQFNAYDLGKQDTIRLFNPESRRDYSDVRDVVRAYHNLVFHANYDTLCRGRIFNIGSGTSYSVFDTFRILENIKGKSYQYEIQPSQEDIIPNQVCNYNLINQVCGWRPWISFSDSLKDMVK
jgi:GDP-4-dehydro-6-deoxy-D-mannose reductase